jgi:hypothetical protein
MEHALTAAALLDIWERGRSQPPVERTLSLLALATGPETPSPPARISIGQRDAKLLKLRELVFGPRLTGQTDCPACRRPVEMDFAVSDVCDTAAIERPETGQARFGDLELQFRPPHSDDLDSLPAQAGLAAQKRALMERCVTKASRDGEQVPVGELPDDLVDALSERLAELDPGGDLQLALTCPHCGQNWRAPLDIVTFLWAELDAWAVRVLREVHVLASAYGWRESDVLAMSPCRRQAYLEMIQP